MALFSTFYINPVRLLEAECGSVIAPKTHSYDRAEPGCRWLATLIVCVIIVGNTILLPFVIAVFVCYLINALAAMTRNIGIFSRALPNSVRIPKHR